MGKLVAVSPVGKNGQTVVPATIRRMFKIDAEHNLVGFYLEGKHVELAPVSVVRETVGYSDGELDKLDKIRGSKGGKKFHTAAAAKRYLNSL
jgi:bifunctional DNA-binding transcriptional regulator/antitoxin component of YhaV-PrlF toxin-antitoxin module